MERHLSLLTVATLRSAEGCKQATRPLVNRCGKQYSGKATDDLAVSPEHHLDADIDAGGDVLACIDDD